MAKYGTGKIYGTGRCYGFQIPQGLTLALDSRRLRVSFSRRHLLAIPEITRLQVTPDA